MSDPTIAVIIIRLNTVLASTGASRHNTGSRNLPIGNQPALNANSQIIIRANHGVKTVYSTTPPSVDVYSVPTTPAPGNDLAEGKPQIEREHRRSYKQHQGPRKAFQDYIGYASGIETERDAEVAGQGVPDMDQVLFPERLVYSKEFPQSLAGFGWNVRVESVEVAGVARLGIY